MAKIQKKSKINVKSLIDLDAFPALRDISEEQIIELLWRKGSLEWQLDSAQKEAYAFFHNTSEKITAFSISRQVGKTWTACVIGVEFCLQNPNCQVKYCAGNAKTAIKATRTNLMTLFEQGPKELKPTWDRTLSAWKFKNGSLLYLEALDSGKADDLRGTPAHLIIVDEAAFISDIKYAVYSVLMPMTMTTKGKFLIITTPPKSQGHEYMDIVTQCKAKGTFFELDAYTYIDKVKNDPPHFKDRFTLEELENIKANSPSNVFNREYLCQFDRDEDHSVIPEFTKLLQKEIVKEWPQPAHYDAYVSMDLAMNDLTAVLFAYYDFVNNKVIIQDEFEVNGKKLTIDHLGKTIKTKERELWKNEFDEPVKPFKRICDINEQIARQDLRNRYDLDFSSARKDDKDAGIAMLRVKLEHQEIIIHPRCRKLIFHLENATWNKSRTSFERTAAAGHYDFVDTLIYLIRAVKYRKNPTPEKVDNSKQWFYEKPKAQNSLTIQQIRKLFNPKMYKN